MKYNLKFFVFFVCLLSFMLYSEDVPNETGNASQLNVVYYPYIRTCPDYMKPKTLYTTWHYDRMERDLRDMTSCGISGVIIAIAPPDLAKEHFLNLYNVFIEMALKECGEKFTVSIMLAPKESMELSSTNIEKFLSTRNITTSSSYLKFSNKPVVFYSDKVKISDIEKSTCMFLNLPEDFKCSNPDPEPFLAPVVSKLESPALTSAGIVISQVFAGYVNPETLPKSSKKIKWIIPRRRTKNFIAAITDSSKGNYTILTSWNNFSNMSGIENNTYDGTLMYDALKKYQKAIQKEEKNKK